ncbi:unnamed protein product [Owenia fusiformis]|uniref:TRAFD1/XAF1 zinc finger domain-containing protein n=1 Tax=Owenia fusiformis TaxID=6347 RepID=A0A8J1UWR9_OWEFU|nr:unnamed protein product [Owenia fusiformis]
MSEQEMKYCSNCKRDIAMVNYTMHELHCRRNIVLCEHCKEPVPRTEMEEHFEEEHAKVNCELCKKPIEKSKLEEHKDVCPKRLAKCPFCELEQPHSELKEHEDFCGTRTEFCANCSQYIMVKHLNQHEDSNCAFPEPKNQPSSQNSRHEPDIIALDDTFSPFAMEEFGRLTDMHNLVNPKTHGAYGGANVNSNTGINANRSKRTNGNTVPQNRPNRSNMPRSSAITSHSLPRNRGTNQTLPHNRSTNQNELPRSRDAAGVDLPRNRQAQGINSSSNSTNRTKKVLNKGSGAASNPRTTSSNIPDTGGGSSGLGNDLDRLLAMHLAHDLTPDDLDDPDLDERSNNEECLPCEFCGKPFPFDSLIQHQTGCGPSELHTPSPDSNISTPIPDRASTPPNAIHSNPDANNSPSRRNTSPRTNPPPNMVDNLAYLTAHEWFSSTSTNIPPEFTTESDIMLPCEFCDQLLPEDFLVQHQAVCAANRAATPDITNLPSRSQPRSSVRPTARSQQHQATAAVNSIAMKSKRHQSGPSFTFLNDTSNSVVPSGGTSYHRTEHTNGQTKPKDKNKFSERNIDGSIVDKTYKMMGSTHSTHRDSRSNHQIKPKSKNRSLSSGKQSETNESRSGSAARTRRTLDRLLEDPTYTTADLLAHMDSYVESVDSNAAMGSKKDASGATGGSVRSKKNESAELDRLFGDLALDGYNDLATRRPSHNDGQRSRKPKSDTPELGAVGYQASFAGASPNSHKPRKNRAFHQRDIGDALEDSVLRPAQSSAGNRVKKKPGSKTRK